MTLEDLLNVIETEKVVIIKGAFVVVDIEDTAINIRKRCKEYMNKIVLFAKPLNNGIEITIED